MKAVFTNKMEAGDSRWLTGPSGTCKLKRRCGTISSIAPKGRASKIKSGSKCLCHWEGTEHRQGSIRNHLYGTHVDETFALSVHLDLSLNCFRTSPNIGPPLSFVF